jgi:hypothetical protein
MFSLFQSRPAILKFGFFVTSVATCFYAVSRYRNQVDEKTLVVKNDIVEKSNEDGTSIW